MFKRIMVPLDGSLLAEEAISPALVLARQFDAELLLLRVVTPQHVGVHFDGAGYAEMLVQLREYSKSEAISYLETHQRILTEQGYNVRQLIVDDDFVAEAILEHIESEAIDILVMSTHGRGGIRRWVFGSIADKVLRQADIPVMLVRATEKETDWDLADQAQVQTNIPPIK